MPDMQQNIEESAQANANVAVQESGNGQKPGKRGRKGPWNVVFVIALVVFIVSVSLLGLIFLSYCQGKMKYNDIADKGDIDTAAVDKDYRGVTIDWDALLAANPDTVGWIYVPGTAINYPVVQGGDNEYYLTHDFDGDAGWLANYGAIFLDYRNKRDWTDQAYFIYGHHMNDGSMFADVAGMSDQGRFDSCRTAYFLTPNGNFKLRTFTLVHCDADDPLVETTFASKEDMTAYLQDKMDRSIVECKDAPKASQIKKVFALATCDNYSAGRYVLYTYVEGTSVDGLEGQIGISEGEDGSVELVDDLSVKGQEG